MSDHTLPFLLKLARLIILFAFGIGINSLYGSFFFFHTGKRTVALCTNRPVSSAGLAQYCQANSVTTLAATEVDYGLSVIGKQRNSTVSLNVTRYQGFRGNARRRMCRGTTVFLEGLHCYDLISRRLRDRKEVFSAARVPPVVIM